MICQSTQLHRYSAGPYRRQADAQRPGGRDQSHRPVGPEQERGRQLSSRVPDQAGYSSHGRTEGVPAVLAGLLRRVLRRSDQRNSLGIGVGTESSNAQPGLVLLSRASRFRQESVRFGEHGAWRYLAGEADPAVPLKAPNRGRVEIDEMAAIGCGTATISSISRSGGGRRRTASARVPAAGRGSVSQLLDTSVVSELRKRPGVIDPRDPRTSCSSASLRSWKSSWGSSA